MLPHKAIIIKLINHNRSLPEKIIMVDDESLILIIQALPIIISILVLIVYLKNRWSEKKMWYPSDCL